MKRAIIYSLIFLVILCTLPVSNAIWLPWPSPYTVADKPVKYTAYNSYLDGSGVVRLRRYIKQPAIPATNPFVGKKIKSITKVNGSAEQNKWIAEVVKQCGSIDAVFMIEAESGWILNRRGESSPDYGLFQWNMGAEASARNKWIVRHPDFNTWEFQVREGCKDFRAVADVNEVLWMTDPDLPKEWRAKEAWRWYGMPNAYKRGIQTQFVVVTE